MFEYIEHMRNALPNPTTDQADESWEQDEQLDRDEESEPSEPYLRAHDHEDGYEKAMMVGHRADRWARDVNDQDAHDAASLARMGHLGEG